MYEFKSWWAGMIITNHTNMTKTEAKEVIFDLQRKLNTRELKVKTCGVNITVDTLCIDFKDDTDKVKYINLKAESSK